MRRLEENRAERGRVARLRAADLATGEQCAPPGDWRQPWLKPATPTTNAGFNADWASPPGDRIEAVLEERGWTRAELAQRLDFSAKHGNELLGQIRLNQ